MIVKKVPIDSGRVREIPQEGFSWIDRRFIREGFIDKLPGEAILLYFFLVAVSDAQGLSYYADPTVRKILKLDGQDLVQARQRLISAGLILYRHPLYQVLPVPERNPERRFSPRPSSDPTQRGGDPLSLREIFKHAGFSGGDVNTQESQKGKS
jgi:hypothetical protein